MWFKRRTRALVREATPEPTRPDPGLTESTKAQSRIVERNRMLRGEMDAARGQQERRYHEPSPFVTPFRPEDDPWVWEK